MKFFCATLIGILVLDPSLASATSVQVMTFTGVGAIVDTWVEDGITATGNIGGHGLPDSAHLESTSGSTPFSTAIDFVTGSLFDAVSIDIVVGSTGYCGLGPPTIPSQPSPECLESSFDDPITFLGVEGFLDGVVVGSLALYIPDTAGFQTIPIDSLPTMDHLRVRGLNFGDLGLGGSCANTWCTHFNIDNLVVSAAPAVPEPIAAVLFGAGLAVTRFATRRR